MIAVVTGSSGFLGTTLVRRLVSDGHEVRCLRHRGPRARKRALDAPSIESHDVDFTDPASIEATGALDGACTIFHLAGVTRGVSPDDFQRGNVAPTTTLLRALGNHTGSLHRFVYVSSQAAAGPAFTAGVSSRESDQPRPIEAYGTSKLDAEREVERWSDRVPITIVRPCAVYGPFDRDFLGIFRQIAYGLALYPMAPDHTVSLAHADDVITGLILAARAAVAEGRTYFLAGAPVSWRQFYAAVAEAVGINAAEVRLPASVARFGAAAGELYSRLTGHATLLNRSKHRLATAGSWVCSAERANRELGWAPRCGLATGVRDTYLWYLHNGWLRQPFWRPQERSMIRPSPTR